ncbi:recombinational DNA repair ATPase [Arthrobacter phage vB_ArtM-ArV1]|uniref:Recombinational DNA repair ATPase n=1 Tax=Arthrobacter phage vB_ArtM-ArV1 TaxID=1566993 RepID=A0A0A7HER9_9CAUD|nr:recombinational DNA repair ATPase [Arthrobacter phage vB_ArtM-ArV1]AIZ01724.1 recombinational DNA repair ATPase [Arthrobacter phage vB_ArtM-ArV1]
MHRGNRQPRVPVQEHRPGLPMRGNLRPFSDPPKRHPGVPLVRDSQQSMITRGSEVVHRRNHQLGKVLGFVPGGYEVIWSGSKAITYEDERTIELRFPDDEREPMESMKVIALQAENVKRLTAVRLAFDGTLQVIGGDNGEGKSSVLDAIWLAIGGRQAVSETQTTRPIHDGADTATATVDLGEIIVTRTWKRGKPGAVKVTTPEGAEHKSPQAILDALTANVGMDPLAFTQLSAKAQVAQLLELVDLPFVPAELDEQYAETFKERTEVNRRVVDVEARLNTYPLPPEDLPEAEVDIAGLVEEVRKGDAKVAAVHRANEDYAGAFTAVRDLEARLVAAKAHEEAMRQALATAEAELDASPDVKALHEKLSTVGETNRLVRLEAERQRGLALFAEVKTKANALTVKLDNIKETRTQGLANANWPIEGLGFDADGLTYNGVPFKQASSAEQIRVSMAMAMALQPTLKTLFIRDGSLLDGKNMAMVADLAAKNGFQVIMERVGANDKGAIIIEDGTVKAAS